MSEPEDHVEDVVPDDDYANNLVAAGAVTMALQKAGVEACPVANGDVFSNVVEVRFDFLKSPYRLTVERVDVDEEPF